MRASIIPMAEQGVVVLPALCTGQSGTLCAYMLKQHDAEVALPVVCYSLGREGELKQRLYKGGYGSGYPSLIELDVSHRTGSFIS